MKNLKRYDVYDGGIDESPNGDYVKFSDITEALKILYNKQSDAIIADIKEVVRSWFAFNDNLSHRECDILNSVVKCYKQ
jgi:ABC-type amino acid transport substrate-binding protein